MDVYVRCNIATDQRIKFPVTDSIVVFICAYCKTQRVKLHLITTSQASWPSGLDFIRDILANLSHEFMESVELPASVQLCDLPAAVSSAGCLVHSGLCALLRGIIKTAHSEHPHSCLNQLLGHREVCLKACAEVSVWTRYCEVDLPAAVERSTNKQRESQSTDGDAIAPELRKLENHLRQPPIVRNRGKRQREMRSRKQQQHEDLQQSFPVNGHKVGLEHIYAEGIDFTVTDLVLFPCVNYLLGQHADQSWVQRQLTKTLQWYQRIRSKPCIQDVVSCSGLRILDINPGDENMAWCLPELTDDVSALSIRDQIKDKVKIDTAEVEAILTRVPAVTVSGLPCKDVKLPWQQFPPAVHPSNGDLPEKRLQRKCEQLESMAQAVCMIARPGDVIVDFCSGGGHLGILLAYLLPKCKVILVENKEESISRAVTRIESLQQDNMLLYQCNLDYFHGHFDIGVTLHACGTATDLVLQRCLDKGASFVVCPCCYGGIQCSHTMAYPRSGAFMQAGLTSEDYLMLGHAADQTEFNIRHAQQGQTCMVAIDSDRLLCAREHGYDILLSSLEPPSCSPKNRLLLGSKDRTWSPET